MTIGLGIGLGITIGGNGGGAAPTTTIGLAANRTQIGSQTKTFSSTETHRRQHHASPEGDVTELQTIDVGWVMSSKTSWAARTYTVKKFIEYPVDVFHPVLWSGVATKSMSGDTPILSDKIVSSVTGQYLVIPAGDKFWERTVISAGNFPLCELPADATAIGVDDGFASGDLGNSGTIAAGGTGIHGCTAIQGVINKGNARSWFIWGDSLSLGTGDTTGSGAKGGSGYMARTLDPLFGWAKFSFGGQEANDVATLLSTSPFRIRLWIAALPITDVWIEYGVNDLRLSHAATLAANWATLAAEKAVRIHQSTLTNRTTSTDGFATVANQTVQTDGNWSQQPTFNTSIRAVPSYVNGQIFDAVALAESSPGSGKWPANATADGTHPNSATAATIAAGLTVN